MKTIARSHFRGTPFLLRAAPGMGLELFRDMRERGLAAAVLIAECDVAALIEEVKAERSAREKSARHSKQLEN